MNLSFLAEGRSTLLEHMASVGYSERYVGDMSRLIDRVELACGDWEGWDDARDWARDARTRSQLEILRRFDEWAALPRTSGTPCRRAAESAYDRLDEGFREVCDAYLASAAAARKRPTTVRNEVLNAAGFFCRLQELGLSRPSEVTEEDVLEVLTLPDGGPSMSRSHVQRVRAVLSGAGEADGCARLLSYIPLPRGWRRVPDALDADERRRVAEAIADPDSGLSQRDRAMCALMLHAGMRGCDVVALRLGDIDWDRDTISFTQQKTGRGVRLPLTAELGNPLYDYVTGDRGESDDDHVFLSMRWPFGGLPASSAREAAGRLYDAAGVRCGEGDRRGAHLLRRTAATAMVASGAGRAAAAATLGHSALSSTDRYAACDLEALRACALDVSCFPLGKGVLEDEG